MNDHKRLSHMYCLPKLHKHATGSRFIIDATKSSVKPFSNAVTDYYMSKLKFMMMTVAFLWF